MSAARVAESNRPYRRGRSVRMEPSHGVFASLLAGRSGAAVMGILNVTPDSFSDGGRHRSTSAALRRGREMIDEGADLIDVGGESTRPGAETVPESEELRRVIPVIRALRGETGLPLSIDTTKARVAEEALEAGASIVNDVSGARADRRMLDVVATAGAGIVLMHRRGTPRTMQIRPRYRDVVGEVRRFLAARVRKAKLAGIPSGSICVDPGIGFGKTLRHNLELLRGIGRLADLGYPILVGASRKSFLGTILGGAPVEGRLEASIAAAIAAVSAGARIVRVHDVGPTVRALRIVDAIGEA